MKKEFTLTKSLYVKAFILSFIIVLNHGITYSQGFHVKNAIPVYKGGFKAMKEFIDKNLIYPDSIKKAGISGTVVVSFVVNMDGKVENVKLMRGIHAVCDSEAIRVTRLLQDWDAATMWGKPIPYNFLLPVEFQCELKNINSGPVAVSGIMSDKTTGKPIEGALVLIKGTDVGTVTDSNGEYRLEVAGENFDLEISHVGYITTTEKVGKNRTINAELEKSYYRIDFNAENK